MENSTDEDSPKSVGNCPEIGDHPDVQSSNPVKPENVEHVCTICGEKFIYKAFKEHKGTSKHRQDLRQKQKQERLKRGTQTSQIASAAPFASTPKPTKQRYYFREPTKWPQQVEQYQKILTTFLSLRFCLSNEYKDVHISMDDNTWGLFDDIVIETVDQENHTEIEAIQCEKIQSRNEISINAVIQEKGKLSLLRQFDELVKLRNKKNYENTFFKLYTLAKLKVDTSMTISCNDFLQKSTKESTEWWKDKKLVVALCKKNNPINTTDDPTNICIFKILDQEEKVVPDVEQDLCKFSLFMNQRNTLSLKHLIRMIIEDKFGTTRDITEDLIKFFSTYFHFNPVLKLHKKMTKRDVCLKIAELLLIPYMVQPENQVDGGGTTDLWNSTLEKFDVVVIKNQEDIINKVYSSINGILQTKVDKLDSTIWTFDLTKEQILDEDLKLEIFTSPEDISRKISLSCLYIALWKINQVPLVLVVENEDNLTLINKVINFLHAENLSSKFILATNKNIHRSYFPEQLRTFNNLEDLKKIDEQYLDEVLNDVEIPFLNFSVKLQDITKENSDFLQKVTPEALLNMSFGDYFFNNFVVPLTDDIIDNTLVFDDGIMSKIQKYFGTNNEVKNLSYLVNINGTPTPLEVPPDI